MLVCRNDSEHQLKSNNCPQKKYSSALAPARGEGQTGQMPNPEAKADRTGCSILSIMCNVNVSGEEDSLFPTKTERHSVL